MIMRNKFPANSNAIQLAPLDASRWLKKSESELPGISQLFAQLSAFGIMGNK